MYEKQFRTHFVINQQEISNSIGVSPEKADSLKLQLQTIIAEGRIHNEVDRKFFSRFK